MSFLNPDYQDLQKCIEKKDVKGLMRFLKITDEKKQEDTRAYWCNQAIDALGDLKAANAVKPIIKILEKRDNWSFSTSASAALGKLGDQAAVEPLKRLMMEKHFTAPAAALRDLGWKPGNDEEAAHFHFSILPFNAPDKEYDVFRKLGPKTADIILEIMRQGHIVHGVQVLLALKATASVPALCGMLLEARQEDINRSTIAEALGEFGDPRAIDALVAVLFAKEHSVADAAAAALAKIGDAKAAAPLVRAVSADPRPSFITALAVFKAKEAVKPIAAALTSNNEYVRLAAAAALGEIGDPMAVDGVIGTLEDKDERVRAAAEEALKKLHQTGDRDAQKKIDEALDLKNQERKKQAQQEEEAWAAVQAMSESEMLEYLINLCQTYAVDGDYQPLEFTAREIGRKLDLEGGIQKMRAVFDRLNGMGGSRTLEMLWGGIGDWMS